MYIISYLDALNYANQKSLESSKQNVKVVKKKVRKIVS
jgi:hypothetical protein